MPLWIHAEGRVCWSVQVGYGDAALTPPAEPGSTAAAATMCGGVPSSAPVSLRSHQGGDTPNGVPRSRAPGITRASNAGGQDPDIGGHTPDVGAPSQDAGKQILDGSSEEGSTEDLCVHMLSAEDSVLPLLAAARRRACPADGQAVSPAFTSLVLSCIRALRDGAGL